MPDPIFSHPRLAAVYDALDTDRSDLDVYLGIVRELGGGRVLDIGCGTGTFALLLAEAGHEVVGVDPAAASVAVARAKPGAERVRWVVGDTAAALPVQVDVATLTGNVAQAVVDLRRLGGPAACCARRPATRRAPRPGDPRPGLPRLGGVDPLRDVPLRRP